MAKEDNDSNDSNDSNASEFVFGFGSIMNSSTHAAWLPDSDNASAYTLPGRIARLKTEFGYERRWNFRSSTGFTALGVSRVNTDDSSPRKRKRRGMNGVLFQVPLTMMPGFDRREAGYEKLQIPLEYIELCDDKYETSHEKGKTFELKKSDRIWIYVPKASQNFEADENNPLLQSYVDTVLQGCLQWGGKSMGIDFVLSTGGWSPYFLNDTPSSRRPWLFRKDYETIDAILQQHSDITHYADRRHPEEFASTFLIQRMRGFWGIPQRNRNFTGRDVALGHLHAKLSQQHGEQMHVGGNVNFLFVQGMGGVGKSSLCTEYCYRHFPSSYGLVIWLNAESAETLVADYRQLLADLADGVQLSNNKGNLSTEEVIAEVKTRLFRCKVPWLLVFDNLEKRKLLEKFVPRGTVSGSKGYCLVTSRVVELKYGSGPSSLPLGCLSPLESVEMLRRALVGSEPGDLLLPGSKDGKAVKEICEKLGHLPLALGMAAAYMQRCDVSCVEYADRYLRAEKAGRSLLQHQAGWLHDYSLTVFASLALSLNAIAKESKIASEALRLLCWLGPDHITKALLRGLLSAKKADEEQSFQRGLEKSKVNRLSNDSGFTVLLASAIIFCTVTFLPTTLIPVGNRVRMGTGLLGAVSLLASVTNVMSPVASDTPPVIQQPKLLSPRRSSSRLGADEFEQADIIWNILKSYSILTVKEGKGSMHRLLAEALRSAQEKEESHHNLKICVESMSHIWKFHPRAADTWHESFHVVEHVKSLVAHVAENDQILNQSISLQAGILSKEAGVFSAMAMNGFKEAQASLELALKIFKRCSLENTPLNQATLKAKAEALHELGRVFRYQGNFLASEEMLISSLSIRNNLAQLNASERYFVADTLHELGVLEVKKHSLDTAQAYLTQALEFRRTLEDESIDIDADCAATLHQLATVHVARKPPSLVQAEELLQKALKLSRQIGQRAATLKQLARVSIRMGLLDTAENYLGKALDLYVELYGERTMHINVAAVKFQQGALAYQREQFETAWTHFSECLRIRRHVYAYACQNDSSDEGAVTSDPLHLEVSCVVHELGCVAFAQGRFNQSMTMLQVERSILQKLQESTNQTERLRHAMLTNLTWLRKCAKENGDEAAVIEFTAEHTQLKNKAKLNAKQDGYIKNAASKTLQKEAIQCRLHARRFALAKSGNGSADNSKVLKHMSRLANEINLAPDGSMKVAAQVFYDELSKNLKDGTRKMAKNNILGACDKLRL